MKVTREINNFLVVLRDGGSINMFGAAPYLQERFALSKTEARDALLEWMQGPRHEFIDAEDQHGEAGEAGGMPAGSTYSGEHPYER